MVAINPALDPAQARQGPRGRALPSDFWTWSEAVLASGLRPSVRFVALAVARAAARGNRSKPKCWARLSTLARDTGHSLPTVKRAVRHLVRIGFLVPDPEGEPHGRRAVVPGVSGPKAVRYLVRFEALTPRPEVVERRARKAAHPRVMVTPPPRVMVTHKAEAEERSEGSEAHSDSEAENAPKVEALNRSLPAPQPPAGGPAADGTEGRESTKPRWGPKTLSGLAAAKRGSEPGASPTESAYPNLHSMGIRPSMFERVVECFGPVLIADVKKAMDAKRAQGTRITNYAGLAIDLLKRHSPEGARRYEAAQAHGSRSERKRARDPFDPGPFALGDGLRSPSVPAGHERTRGHGASCTCEPCMAVVMGLSSQPRIPFDSCTFQGCTAPATRRADEGGKPWCAAHYEQIRTMA